MNNCTRCHLSQYRSHVVTGRGDPKTARILLIGEAPGLSEDVLGKAFIGDSGKFLDEILQRAGVPLDMCFFTNTVLCRPCDGMGKDNREPSKEEAFSCLPNVIKIIETAKRIEYVIFVGRIAETYYKSRFKNITSFYIMHPSAILQKGGKTSSLFIDVINILKNRLADLLSGQARLHTNALNASAQTSAATIKRPLTSLKKARAF
jgi:uracil-DNA glycosylase family 4